MQSNPIGSPERLDIPTGLRHPGCCRLAGPAVLDGHDDDDQDDEPCGEEKPKIDKIDSNCKSHLLD